MAIPGAWNEDFKGNSKESMFEGLQGDLKEDLKGDFKSTYLLAGDCQFMFFSILNIVRQ